MWRYHQKTGDLGHVNDDGAETVVGSGYSGRGEGLNNPAKQDVPGVGPIPRGLWSIGAPYHSPNVGPYTMALRPEPDTVTFGRDAFRIHGDNYHQDQSASSGCIILPRPLRERIHESDDNTLEVVEE